MINEIIAQFDDSAREICNEHNGIECDISSIYKKEETLENLKFRVAVIRFGTYSVIYKYTRHSFMSVINSILECFVCFNSSQVAVPLQFLTDFCNVNEVYPLSVPFITTAEGMKQAFSAINNVFSKLKNEILSISCDYDKFSSLITYTKEEFKTLLSMEYEEAELPHALFEFQYKYLTLRFTSSPYINILNGKNEKAIKQLEKLKAPLSCEKRILESLKSEKSIDESSISLIRENASMYNENGVQKGNGKEFLAVFISWIPLTLVCLPVYLAIYYGFMHLESRGAVYLLGPEYNVFETILASFVTSIALSYFVRHKIYKLIFKKDYERYAKMDSIQNGKGADSLMKKFLFFCFAFSVCMMFLTVKFNVNFTDEGIIDNTEFWDITGVFYEYSDIEKVYYKESRENDFGDVHDFPSYVVRLKNGVEIDLYEFADIEDCENELIPYLKQNGIKIIKGEKQK